MNDRRRVTLTFIFILGCLALVAGVAYICAFKLLDRDFWWHIKAGEIMVRTQSLIYLDPFSFTRWNMPYHTTHEWLAQIIFYGLYAVGGSTGIILFRTAMMLATLGVLLAIDRAHAGFWSLLALASGSVLRRAFVERPQLFTFLIFALMIWLACRFLESPVDDKKGRQKILIAFVLLQILWVNLHGAACLLGFGILGAVWLQRSWDSWRNNTAWSWKSTVVDQKELVWTFTGMALAFFVSPNHIHNFRFFSDLMSDKTIQLLSEWQPRPMPLYLREVGPFWVVAALSVWIAGRFRVFTIVLLSAMAFLSLRAFRHETLFVLATIGLTIFSAKHALQAQALWQKITDRPRISLPLFVAALMACGWWIRREKLAFCAHDQLYGYGTFTPGKGAYDFLERENISGDVFNSDGIGGYFEYRGYPHRPMFIDGRNVDYGYDLLWAVFRAGVDPAIWEQLDQQYQFAAAVINFDPAEPGKPIPFVWHLSQNPRWRLVFLDDWCAVYAKVGAVDSSVIDRNAYQLLTPERLENRDWLAGVVGAVHPNLLAELNRAVSQNPDGYKSQLALAQWTLLRGDTDAARQILHDVLQRQPRRPEAYESLAALEVHEQHWAAAARAYDAMLRWAGNLYPNINISYIDSIRAKARS